MPSPRAVRWEQKEGKDEQMDIKEVLENACKAYSDFEEACEEARNVGYKNGYQDGCNDKQHDLEYDYAKGLEDAWELARKIVLPEWDSNKKGYTINEMKEIWNRRGYSRILEDFTAQQALAKIKEYEEKQKEAAEIKVGDEVIYDREKCVVTAIANGGYTIMLLGLGGGYMVRTTRDEIQGKCTGRHFPQVDEVLKQMQEGNE